MVSLQQLKSQSDYGDSDWVGNSQGFDLSTSTASGSVHM